jgi:hypothetical protein
MGGRVARMTLSASRKFFTRGKLPLLLAVLLLVLSFGLEFHHHDDGKAHTDCSLCAVGHQTRSASVQHQESGNPVIARAFLCLPNEQSAPISLHLAVPVIRPPPA